MNWRGPSPHHCARATLCPIWPIRGLNLRSPAPETNAVPLDQLARSSNGVKMVLGFPGSPAHW